MTPRSYALRDDQWNRIEGLLPGRPVMLASPPAITACLLMQFYTAIALEFRGAIYRSLGAGVRDLGGRVVH